MLIGVRVRAIKNRVVVLCLDQSISQTNQGRRRAVTSDYQCHGYDRGHTYTFMA